MYGQGRALTEEELARAIRLDPSQIAGLGPAIESLRAILEERKRKILTKYESASVEKKARKNYHKASRNANPPDKLESLSTSCRRTKIYDLERLWYRVGMTKIRLPDNWYTSSNDSPNKCSSKS